LSRLGSIVSGVRSTLRETAAATAAGLLLTAAFPKPSVAGLAWVALVPLLVSLEGQRPGERFRLGFMAGLVHYLTLLYWVAYTMQVYGHLPISVSIPVLFLFSACLASFFGGFALCCTGPVLADPASTIMAVPALWVGFEYLRSVLFTGFPWELLGYSQYENRTLIQIADLTGIWGVSYLVAMGNALLATGVMVALRRRSGRRAFFSGRDAVAAAAAVLLFAACWGYGAFRIGDMERKVARAPSLRAGMVQGNIAQGIKWNRRFQRKTTEKYVRLSTQLKPERPDLVIWPETATPFYLFHDTDLTKAVLEGVRETGAYFLIGSNAAEKREGKIRYFNSAFLVDPEGRRRARYDKVHLVPYGEYVPLKRFFPFIGKLVEHVGDFDRGVRGEILETDNLRLGVQICYEIIFPSLSRKMADNGASLLVNITNDAWYGRTAAPYQHFSMAVFRAVENRRSLIRAANTGISGCIDPVGRVLARTRLFEDAALTCEVPVWEEKSLYTRAGDYFPALCLAGGVFAVFRRRRRSSR
jgi:apolipoprotein N-acyltransferase